MFFSLKLALKKPLEMLLLLYIEHFQSFIVNLVPKTSLVGGISKQ